MLQADGQPPMNSELDQAAGTVIELTNTLGATAAGVQNTTQAVRVLRRLAAGAARHPERVAVAGLTLLGAAAVLAVRGPAEQP